MKFKTEDLRYGTILKTREMMLPWFFNFILLDYEMPFLNLFSILVVFLISYFL